MEELTTQQIKQEVGEFVRQEFMYGEGPQRLSDSTALVSSGILDSLTTLRLVQFIEQTYGIVFEPHEAGVENLETLEDIARFVMAKRG